MHGFPVSKGNFRCPWQSGWQALEGRFISAGWPQTSLLRPYAAHVLRNGLRLKFPRQKSLTTSDHCYRKKDGMLNPRGVFQFLKLREKGLISLWGPLDP